MPVARLEYLIERCISQQATHVEREEMLDLLSDPQNESIAKQIMKSTYLRDEQLEDMNAESAIDIFQTIIKTDKKKAKPVRILSVWWVAAASVAVVLGLGIYFFMSTTQSKLIVEANTFKDIPPPVLNRATITLEDGSQILLDSVSNGKLAQAGNFQLVKLADGQIAYQLADGRVADKIQYHTLTNPRGSKVINVLLSDGSTVWLNAGSSIKYPVAFQGNERNVNLSGEAFFDIAHNRDRPFLVHTPMLEIKVLGTSFNVAAYENDRRTDAILIRGSVEVTLRQAPHRHILLKPSEKITVQNSVSGSADLPGKNINSDSPIFNVSKIDGNIQNLESSETQWKKNKLVFNNSSLEEIAARLSRWYDVDILISSEELKADKYSAVFNNVPLEKVIQSLQLTGNFKYTITNRTVTLFD